MKKFINLVAFFVLSMCASAQFSNHDTLRFDDAEISSMGTIPLQILPPAGSNNFYVYEAMIKVHSDGFGLTGDLYLIQTNNQGYGTFYPNQTLELGKIILFSSSYGPPSFDASENVPLNNHIKLNSGIYFTTFNGVDPVYYSSTIPLSDSYIEVYIDYDIRSF